MPDETDDNLIRDLGALIAAQEAMRIADNATSEALDQAVRDAGRAVGRTVDRPDPALAVKARQAIAYCRDLMEALERERERARDATARSNRLSRRTAGLLVDIRTARDEIERRKRERNSR
jgi:hypothetical protein